MEVSSRVAMLHQRGQRWAGKWHRQVDGREPVDPSCGRRVPLGAVGGVVLTVDPAEAGRAGTGVAVDAVGAVGSVLARVALALVDVLLALCAPEAGQAGAQEAVDLVLTEASVAAGVCGERTEGWGATVSQQIILSSDKRGSGERLENALGLQSSMLLSQLRPAKPGLQAQR